MLDILAKHPSTAHFISTEAGAAVCRRRSAAGADRPHGEDIPRYHGDIREVMSTMLTSKEFFSQGAYQAKVKTPFEMIVSAVRATGRRGRLRVSAGQPDRAAWAASLSEAGADRLFERQCRMDQFRVAAGAHEFRAGSDAEQGAGNQGGSGAISTDDPAHTARLMLFTDPTAPTRDAIEKAIAEQKAKNPKPRHRRRWWRVW